MAHNFLIGHGERLTEEITKPTGGGPKYFPYSLGEARQRIAPLLTQVINELDELPAKACPHDEAVAMLTLHPSFLAKSYYPEVLLRELGLHAVGSRGCLIKPAKGTAKRQPKEIVTSCVYVAGERSAFRRWAELMPTWKDVSKAATDLRKIEDLNAGNPQEKVLTFHSKESEPFVEVVLHASAEADYIVKGFLEYLEFLGIKRTVRKRFYARGLCFLAMDLPKKKIAEVSRYSYLRAIREMPRLRSYSPVLRSASLQAFDVELPSEPAIDPRLRVAIFDGGMPNRPELKPWVNLIDADGVGRAKADDLEHGGCVTSAYLFGPLRDGVPLPRPYANVDHYRVFDADTANDTELPDVLDRILNVLREEKYQFINLSIGPDLPIEDNEVHMWTAMLDSHFADGKVLATVAVGNRGERDWDSGNARIQVPSDCVNALAIGASDSKGNTWQRAPYSCVGPGRHPGIVKPDAVTFGGSRREPFWFVSPINPAVSHPDGGTSFASPNALRIASGVRAVMGADISTLAIKALLLNTCDAGGHSRREVGWGRLPQELQEIIVCPDGTVRVLYQGSISPGQWLRSPIPLPRDPIAGTTHISSTFTFATQTDPQDPLHYTRSGLEVVFRPHSGKRTKAGQVNADSGAFFRAGDMHQSEVELRRDAQKWETTLHAHRQFKQGQLQEPVFDVHYNARSRGGAATDPDKILYALVVSIRTPDVKDIYDKVLVRYRTKLETMRPIIGIPIEIL